MRRGVSFLVAVALCLGGVLANPARDSHQPRLGAWGVDLTAMDTSVRPGDDFFSYVNGNWVKAVNIPPERSSLGLLRDLHGLSQTRLNMIVDDLRARPYDTVSPDEKKLRDFYEAFIDQDKIEADGLTPVKDDLAFIAHIRNLDGVTRAM